MIKTLYEKFQDWSAGGNIWLLSDLHFEDADCKLMNPNWVSVDEQLDNLKCVLAQDTFVCLGDVGNPEFIDKIRGYKVLITGNHDKGNSVYERYFNEVYNGPLFISNKLLLSHEPLLSDYYLNIHGHVHNGVYEEKCDDNICGLNIAADVVDYKPINLKKDVINRGYLKNIVSLHRSTINDAIERKGFGD